MEQKEKSPRNLTPLDLQRYLHVGLNRLTELPESFGLLEKLVQPG
jgi:hypothetical protein